MYPLNKIITKPIEMYKMYIDYGKRKTAKYKHGICYLTVVYFNYAETCTHMTKTGRNVYKQK